MTNLRIYHTTPHHTTSYINARTLQHDGSLHNTASHTDTDTFYTDTDTLAGSHCGPDLGSVSVFTCCGPAALAEHEGGTYVRL
jgi:hypothetical protein